MSRPADRPPISWLLARLQLVLAPVWSSDPSIPVSAPPSTESLLHPPPPLSSSARRARKRGLERVAFRGSPRETTELVRRIGLLDSETSVSVLETLLRLSPLSEVREELGVSERMPSEDPRAATLLRDATYALQGISGHFTPGSPHAAQLNPLEIRTMNHFAHTSQLYKRVQEEVSELCRGAPHARVVPRRVGHVLRDALDAYDADVSRTHEICKGQSLLYLVAWSRPIVESLRAISLVLDAIRGLGSAGVLSVLASNSSQHGHPGVKSLAEKALRAAWTPYEARIHEMCETGRVSDAHEEFFLTGEGSIREERVPRFLGPEGAELIRKCVEAAKLCREFVPSFTNSSSEPSREEEEEEDASWASAETDRKAPLVAFEDSPSEFLRRPLLGRARAWCSSHEKRLLTHLFQVERLGDSLALMQRAGLLAHSEFARALVEREEDLESAAKCLEPTRPTRGEVPQLEMCPARRHVVLKTTGLLTQHVLHPSDLALYAPVYEWIRRLLALRRDLSEAWSRSARLKTAPATRATRSALGRLDATRHESQHVVQALIAYTFQDVVEDAWSSLRVGVASATSLSELTRAHRRFVQRVAREAGGETPELDALVRRHEIFARTALEYLKQVETHVAMRRGLARRVGDSEARGVWGVASASPLKATAVATKERDWRELDAESASLASELEARLRETREEDRLVYRAAREVLESASSAPSAKRLLARLG